MITHGQSLALWGILDIQDGPRQAGHISAVLIAGQPFLSVAIPNPALEDTRFYYPLERVLSIQQTTEESARQVAATWGPYVPRTPPSVRNDRTTEPPVGRYVLKTADAQAPERRQLPEDDKFGEW
jgi:hypothetical protein